MKAKTKAQLGEELAGLRERADRLQRERQLLAAEIHDGLVQYVTGAIAHLESVATEQQLSSAKSQEAVERAVGLLRRSISEARRLIVALDAVAAAGEGIVPAIQHLVAEYSQWTQLAIRFVHPPGFPRLEPLLEWTIVRIVQESLANIRRHSDARRAEVKLAQRGKRIELEVRDWGAGFDPGRVREDRFGLEGIRRRTALAGGHARIESRPGKGTRVLVELPLPPAVP